MLDTAFPDIYDELKQLEQARKAAWKEVDRLGHEIAELKKRNPRLVWDGCHVRRLRRNRGLSKRMTARVAGVHHTTITRLERSGPNGVSCDVVYRVAQALGVSLEALLPQRVPGEITSKRRS